MAKTHDAKKNVKQKPLKTLKEKQREKKAKKRLKSQGWTGIDNYVLCLDSKSRDKKYAAALLAIVILGKSNIISVLPFKDINQ